MKDIVIIGCGGFGKEVKMLIDQINIGEKKFNILGFYDDKIPASTLINGYPVLGKVADLNNIDNNLCAVIAVGSPVVKKTLFTEINNPLISFPVLIHPNVIMGDDEVFIGEGCIILPGCMMTVNFTFGKFVTFHLSCTVGHDTIIGDFCSFMPAVNIAGEVEIGQVVYIGTGAKIINQVSIGENTVIGAGAVVAKSLPANCTAVGIPARAIKFHN